MTIGRRGGLVLALGLGFLCAGTAVQGASVPSERLTVAYDATRREMHGTLDVAFESAPGTIYFLLLPNLDRTPNPYLSPRSIDTTYPNGFSPSGLDVVAVTCGDEGDRSPAPYRLLAMPPAFQTYNLEETVLAVDAAASTIRIEFVTSVPRLASGDGGVTDETFTWRFGWFPLLVEDDGTYEERDGVLVHGEDDAFPLVLPRANVEAEFSLPGDARFYAGADAVEDLGLSDDGTRHVRTHNESSTRSLAIAFGTQYQEYELDGPTPIRVAYFEGHENTARLLATYARDILAEYEGRYGAYPRSVLTIVENPNTAGDAFSADGIVWLSTRFFTHRDVLLPEILHRVTEYVLAHEIAHQWFGVGMGVDLDGEGWLSEGLAQYASVLYFERAHGADEPNLIDVRGEGILEEYVSRLFGYLNLREHLIELPYLTSVWSAFDEALVKPAADLDYANETSTRLYDKGYVVARALAAAVGEETFDRALSRAVEAGRAARLDSALLRSLVEEESGVSLEEWFSVWVYGAGSVDYTVRIVGRAEKEGAYETTVAVTREGGTVQDVEVEATLASGATVRLAWDGEAATGRLSEESGGAERGPVKDDRDAQGRVVFRTPSPVTEVTIDPDHRLPDRDRINNHYPVKIVVAATRAAYPLDAYVLSPTTSGGIVLSRLDRFELDLEETSAAVVVRQGRDVEISAAAALSSAGLVGSFAYAVTRYEPIETGAPGTTWDAALTITGSAYRLVSQGEPFYVARLAAVRLPSVTTSRIAAAAVDLVSGGSARLSLTAFDELRVFPGMYLQGTGFLGFSSGDVPQSLLFDFNELVSMAPAPAPNKLSASLQLEFPSAEGLPYNVFNLAMIDGQSLRVYVAGGVGWTSVDRFGTTSPSVEAGIEEAFDLSTLGGLVSLSVRVGVAVPVTGEPVPAVYVGFSL
ncbi:MAG: M1 family aminopeptidase [Thermotogota bacterium]